MNQDIVVFSGNANQDFAAEICKHLKIELSNSEVFEFSNENFLEAQREINLQPMLANLKEGDRLRISISGSSWPAIGINPGNNLNLPQGSSPHCLITTIILLLANSKLEFKSLISS